MRQRKMFLMAHCCSANRNLKICLYVSLIFGGVSTILALFGVTGASNTMELITKCTGNYFLPALTIIVARAAQLFYMKNAYIISKYLRNACFMATGLQLINFAASITANYQMCLNAGIKSVIAILLAILPELISLLFFAAYMLGMNMLNTLDKLEYIHEKC